MLAPLAIQFDDCAPGDLIDGWEFIRNPEHWYHADISAGCVLVERPGPSPERRGELHPWSIMRRAEGPNDWRPWIGIPASVAEDLLRLDRVERTPHYPAALRRIVDRGRHPRWSHGSGLFTDITPSSTCTSSPRSIGTSAHSLPARLK